MVFEYILKTNGIDPQKDLNIVQNIVRFFFYYFYKKKKNKE